MGWTGPKRLPATDTWKDKRETTHKSVLRTLDVTFVCEYRLNKEMTSATPSLEV